MCCYGTPKSQRCSGIDLITISQKHSKKDRALGGELDSKISFNAQLQEVNKNQKSLILLCLFSHQVLFLISTRDIWEVPDHQSSEN